MKVKYISDDNHEFETKTQCEKYEQALENVNDINGLPVKEIDGKKWFKIDSLAEFYFFDHMDGKSTKTMYDISKIAFNINHYMPFWITKDFEEGVMIDKKRVEVIDQSIEFLNEKIKNLKDEKKSLEELRGIEITDDDYKLIIDQKAKEQPIEESKEPVTDNTKPSTPVNVKPRGIEYAKKLLDREGIQLEPIDIVQLAMEEAELSVTEWNNLNENKIKNLIEEQINILV